MLEKLEKVNYIQVALLAILVALVFGIITPENGLDVNETITKIALLIPAVGALNWASLRLAVGELEKQDLGKSLNQTIDMLNTVLNGSREPAQMATVTTTTVSGISPAELPGLPPDSEIAAG